MRKLVLSISLGLILIFSVSLMANIGETPKAIPSEDIQEIVSSGSRAPCTMVKHNGAAASYWSGYQNGTGTYTYYNPEVECAAPIYPFEITSFTFSLYDDGSGIVWPAQIDIVVYYPVTAYDSCSGPGAEVCRYSLTADALTYQYPTFGTFTLPPGCCVTAPFFMGIEYTAGGAATTPSILFDNNAAPDTCDNWQYYTDGLLYEWYNFWNQPGPGYPMFGVGGETVSANCQADTCDWEPGDPYKMHWPQLPNPMGWDVNATAPLVLADDWMCSQTGWVKDIHWWGSWMHGDEGVVLYFVLSIHEDIPANPPDFPYSRPGPTLWEREVTAQGVPPADPPGPEGWYDPMQGQFFMDDHMAYFQYNVCLDSLDWFWQNEGTIYWLNISAVVADPVNTQWGWKSTLDHWNDDAVWAEWGILNWIDMWEPPMFDVSLDLSFVITGEGPEAGACCWQDPPWPDWFCTVTTEDSCINVWNGIYEGDGTVCLGQEACCLADGSCVMADALCCVNELFGTPQGPGTACTAVEACCFTDGSCAMYDPICCDDQGGVPQGAGSMCTAAEACCFTDGSCANMDPLCCQDQNGTPQGPGTSCSGQTVACCLPGGGCMDIDALCCDDMGGWISPLSAVCLGDLNSNGIDDACDIPTGACCLSDNTCQQLTASACNQITGASYLGDGTSCRGDSDGDGFDDACVDPWPNHKMHFPQLPDPTGWDVMASHPIILADDWMCIESGPVTDIHWWGSWLNDNVGTVDFCVLSIHEDIPADPPAIPYSRPGNTLWEFEAWEYGVIPYDPPTMEGWYDPSQENALFDNHIAYFRYDVFLPEQMWFMQDSGRIYWLNIVAVGVGPTGGEQWGWKSTQDRWNDDAVWAYWGDLNWIEMYEPAEWKYNQFIAEMGIDNMLNFGDGENAYGDGFYWYESGWWNIWFYDDPFVFGKKEIMVNMMVLPTGPEAWLTFALNWSTDIWSLEGNPPGERRPPLPWDMPEEVFIGREILYDGPIQAPTPLEFYYEVADYNPEWVSIDIMGQFFLIEMGSIAHRCRPSLNLAFVITGGLPCQGICGDANNDGTVNVSDAVYIINYVFVGGGEPQPVLACGDANGDGMVNVSDAVWIINYVFVGGGPPGDCAPGSPQWYNGDCCPWAGQK
jgi:hypothetical protein